MKLILQNKLWRLSHFMLCNYI